MTTDLSKPSRLLADELRRAECSINIATRDTVQFLLTTLEVTQTRGLSPSVAHRTVRATVDALNALVESQNQLGVRAHAIAEKTASSLGLTVVDWGEGAPKPAITHETAAPAEVA